MALVGDITLALRELAPDPCKSLAAPASVKGTAIPIAGGLFSTGTLWIKVTQLTQWGESNPSAEQAITIGSGSNLTVTGQCSRLAVFINVYFTQLAAGLEDAYIQFAVSAQSTFNFTLNSTDMIVPAIPPTKSSAYLPDSDGTSMSASLVYRWMEDGLKLAGQLTDGIRDITGVPSTQGVAQYNLIGLWKKIDNQFFDGYPFAAGTKGQIFRHSPVTGLTGVGTLNAFTDRQVIEVWPQANRTAGQGTLTNALTATATTVNYTAGPSSFVLGFGMALIGQYPPQYPLSKTGANSCELIYYSNYEGNVFSNVTRGMGGSLPQAWPAGTNVQELNLYFSGLRFPTTYKLGMAALTTGLPPAWEDLIRTYLLYRFRDAETDRTQASDLLKEFNAKCSALSGNRIVFGPRQVSIGGTGGVEVVGGGFGSPFGRIILP